MNNMPNQELPGGSSGADPLSVWRGTVIEALKRVDATIAQLYEGKVNKESFDNLKQTVITQLCEGKVNKESFDNLKQTVDEIKEEQQSHTRELSTLTVKVTLYASMLTAAFALFLRWAFKIEI